MRGGGVQALILAIVLVVIFVVIATAAFSQQRQCGQSSTIYEKLISDWGESRIYTGLDPYGVMEVWDNPETGTWTLLQTRADGVSCIVSTGQHGGAVLRQSGEPG